MVNPLVLEAYDDVGKVTNHFPFLDLSHSMREFVRDTRTKEEISTVERKTLSKQENR